MLIKFVRFCGGHGDAREEMEEKNERSEKESDREKLETLTAHA